MATTLIRDVFEVDATRYWRDIYLDPAFQLRNYREAMGCDRVEVLARTGDIVQTLAGDGSAAPTLKIRFRQRMDAPAVLRKVFGDGTTMEETGRWDVGKGRWYFELRPDRLTDKICVQGEVWLEPLGPDRVTRLVQLTFRVDVFGIGAVIEKFMQSSAVQNFEKQTALTRQFIREWPARTAEL